MGIGAIEKNPPKVIINWSEINEDVAEKGTFRTQFKLYHVLHTSTLLMLTAVWAKGSIIVVNKIIDM